MIKVLLVVVLLAALVYGLVWTIERRRTVGRFGRRARPRPVAPDDDEDFLRSLRREREETDDDEDPGRGGQRS